MLTKESIEEKTFKKGLFGYNKDEVNSFMREVSDEFASLQAKYDAAVAENELAQNSLRENSVKIYELEKQLEQAAPGSKKEQNAANSEANKRANEVLSNAKAELAKLKAEMEELKANGGTVTATASTTASSINEDALEADPITKLKMKSQTTAEPQKLKMKPKEEPKEESKPQAFAGKSAVTEDEEDEVIVGEIEEGVKRNQVLIGDGDEDDDFEFL